MKLLLVAIPKLVLTVIGPVVAPSGTIAAMCVVENTSKLALTPLKRTLVTPRKFVPSMVTLVSGKPLVGEKPVMVGTVFDEPVIVKPCEILKKILPAPSTLMRAVPLGVPGIMKFSDPSLGVLLVRTMGKVL